MIEKFFEQGPCPALKTIRFAIVFSPAEDSYLQLPPSPLLIGTPNLQCLVLNHTTFSPGPSTTATFKAFSLVHLCILLAATKCFGMENTSQWLDLLRTQPKLQFLTLEIGDGSMSPRVPCRSEPLFLPCLERLRIVCAMDDMNDFIRSMVLPPTCNLRIESWDTTGGSRPDGQWQTMQGVNEGIKRYFQSQSTIWGEAGRIDTPDDIVFCAITTARLPDPDDPDDYFQIEFNGPSKANPPRRIPYFHFSYIMSHITEDELASSDRPTPIENFFAMMTEATSHWTINHKIGLDLDVDELQLGDRFVDFCRSLATNVRTLIFEIPKYTSDYQKRYPLLFLHRKEIIFPVLEHFVTTLQHDVLVPRESQPYWRKKISDYLDWAQTQLPSGTARPALFEDGHSGDLGGSQTYDDSYIVSDE
ncbi:hypothetical protein CPC08DRAFT_728489 [Agrocybe pediades]|nr:hypothetical protein CPC08DRAFT_728489 [Agrocybe pediades]